MKKTMLFAAIAAGFLAQADVESANICGYQHVSIPEGWSTFTATFKNVGGTKFDLKQIIPCDAAGVPLTSSKNKVRIQKLGAEGEYDSTQYAFTTASGKGWNVNSVSVEDGVVTFNNGEGFAVYNGQGAEITFQVCGEVDLKPLNSCPTGWSVMGNSTPKAIDLKDIVLCDAAGVALTSSKNKVRIQMLATSGEYDSTQYAYTTASGKGWNVNSVAVEAGAVMIQPGSGFAVYNGQGETVYLKLPAPVAE